MFVSEGVAVVRAVGHRSFKNEVCKF
jgi:hypothetical protein